jgi:hypothetical protein
VNRELLQKNANREERLRDVESELEAKKRRRSLENKVSVLLLLVSIVLAGIFAVRVTPVQVDGGTSSDPTKLSFTRSHADWLNENYNESVENGFCLFGHHQDDTVVVEEVEFVDNPPHQEKGAMSFTCIPQIFAYSSSLVTREEYRLLGAVHTHPGTAYLSQQDKETFRSFDPVLSVFGVYNGERLRMYSDPNQSTPIHSVIRLS